MATPLSNNLDWKLANPIWAASLNPFIANPTNSISLLKDVVLSNGATVIPHRLGRQMQGWFIADINGAASIFRSAPLNDTTLTLTSDALVTANIGVF